MNMPDAIVKQHLIDPELCIRCNTCEESCTMGAISNNGINYVVDASLCNSCRDCVPGCPTGAIDNWWPVARSALHSIDEQFGWEKLPPPAMPTGDEQLPGEPAVSPGRGAPPSAAKPAENLYTRDRALQAAVIDNVRVTADSSASDIRHIVLDVGAAFPFLEGQSIGIIPPGVDAHGRRHAMRLYSIASARGGEAGSPGKLAITVKRVLEDHDGHPHRGICSNFVCDLRAGDRIDVVGPYGASFLMPDDADSHLIMMATGTGIAPMRAMIEQRLRRGSEIRGRQLLFYGGRTPQELPYLDELCAQPAGFLELHTAFSRIAGEPRQYVQDVLRDRHDCIAQLLADARSHFYLCGLKGMEAGVEAAFASACALHGMDWAATREHLTDTGRLHIETY